MCCYKCKPCPAEKKLEMQLTEQKKFEEAKKMKTEFNEIRETCEVRAVRMLTQSEISALREDNIKAHLRMQELIAEAKKQGPLVIR